MFLTLCKSFNSPKTWSSIGNTRTRLSLPQRENWGKKACIFKKEAHTVLQHENNHHCNLSRISPQSISRHTDQISSSSSDSCWDPAVYCGLPVRRWLQSRHAFCIRFDKHAKHKIWGSKYAGFQHVCMQRRRAKVYKPSTASVTCPYAVGADQHKQSTTNIPTNRDVFPPICKCSSVSQTRKGRKLRATTFIVMCTKTILS